MKRYLSLLLALLLILGLCACGEPTDKPGQIAPVLQVGFGRTDITPDQPMPLQGYENPGGRVFDRVLDPIYATCIAFSDGQERVLLYQLDLTGGSWQYVTEAKQLIQEATGVPVSHIMVSVTHNHSSPSLGFESPFLDKYIALLKDQMVAAAQAALADLKEAQMYTGSIETEGLNFVRHYTMDNGTVAGDNFGSFEDTKILGHVGQPDRELQVLRFTRAGGKDVVLANWQAHPHRAGGQTVKDLTSDIVGPMTTYVESALGCNFAYFTGASGNLNSHSNISGENITADYVEQGRELGRYAYLACTNMTPAATGKVQLLPQSYTAEGRNGNRPPLPLNAFSIGDVGFAVVPYEMFSQSGEYIKENSPFQQTFVVTCANASNGYMPCENNYYYGDIESYESTKCYFVPGTAEELAGVFASMLSTLHATRGVRAVEPDPTATLYWNVDRGAERTAQDGKYSVRLLQEQTLCTLTVPSQEMMAAMDRHDVVGLTVEGDTVTSVCDLTAMPQQLLCMDYTVQSMGGSKVKVNSSHWLIGKEIMLDVENVPILDVSEIATQPGATTTLQKTDRVTALADSEGNLLCLYVSGRDGIFEASTRYCQHCDAEVEFLNWFSQRSLPVTEGHYYLEGDVTLADTQIIGNQNITLDMNGFSITQTTEGKGIYHMKGGAQLTLMDSVSTSVITPSTTAWGPDHEIQKGMVVRMETDAKELNVYGGKYDATATTAQHACILDNMSGTMNIYGGEFLGGTTFGAGGGTVVVQGRTNIYGGVFHGGSCTETAFETEYMKGGGNVYVSNGGILNIYGGEFLGGQSAYNGGTLLTNGQVIFHGGKLVAGTAAGQGNAVFASAVGALTFAGKVSIEGTVATHAKTALEVTEDCPFTVNRNTDGILTIQ